VTEVFRVAPVDTETDETPPRALLALRFVVPVLAVNDPENVLPLLSCKMPAPVFVTPPTPEIVLLKFSPDAEVTSLFRVTSPFRVMVPEYEDEPVFVPPKVTVPPVPEAITKGLGIVLPAVVRAATLP
jgi:hypothetical protein